MWNVSPYKVLCIGEHRVLVSEPLQPGIHFSQCPLKEQLIISSHWQRLLPVAWNDLVAWKEPMTWGSVNNDVLQGVYGEIQTAERTAFDAHCTIWRPDLGAP